MANMIRDGTMEEMNLYKMPEGKQTMSLHPSPTRMILDDKTTATIVYPKSKLDLDWDSVFNDKHRFFSAMTTEEFNKMMKNQENNVVKIPGNLREPSFKQHLPSQSTQDALFTVDYHLMKLHIETKDKETVYIFSFLPETNVLLHNTRGRTSLFSRGYSTTQYQILSPMAYHLTEDEKQSVAILRLNKFNPLMYNRLYNWNTEFMWAFHMPLQVEKFVGMDENNAFHAVIFTQALQLAGVESLQYLSDNLRLKVITWMSKNGIEMPSSDWFYQGLSDFLLGNPALNNALDEQLDKKEEAKALNEQEATDSAEKKDTKRKLFEFKIDENGDFTMEEANKDE